MEYNEENMIIHSKKDALETSNISGVFVVKVTATCGGKVKTHELIINISKLLAEIISRLRTKRKRE